MHTEDVSSGPLAEVAITFSHVRNKCLDVDPVLIENILEMLH